MFDKELEEIKSIVAIHFGALGFLNPSENEQILKDRDRVLNALQRLESIDNANPSEAMVCLEYLNCIPIGYTNNDRKKDYTIIKQALLKSQEQEKENKELKENIKRWHDLLLKSGIDSKGMVADEIENYWAIKAGV